MTTITDFNEDGNFSNETIAAWNIKLPEYFPNIRGEIKDISKTYRSINDHVGDEEFDCDYGEHTTIELKSRRKENIRYAMIDVAIETVGGSAVHESNADFWGHGYYINGEMKYINIYNLKNGLKQWLLENKHKYPERPTYSQRNGSNWDNKWIAVPLEHIKQFLIPKPLHFHSN